MRSFTPEEVIEILQSIRLRKIKVWSEIIKETQAEMKRIIEAEIETNICNETQKLIDSTEMIVKDAAKIIDEMDNEAE